MQNEAQRRVGSRNAATIALAFAPASRVLHGGRAFRERGGESV